MKNPQMYQNYQSLLKSQNNPQELLNTILSNYTPEQIQSFRKFVNSYGISNEQLNNFSINTK